MGTARTGADVNRRSPLARLRSIVGVWQAFCHRRVHTNKGSYMQDLRGGSSRAILRLCGNFAGEKMTRSGMKSAWNKRLLIQVPHVPSWGA